MPGLQQQKRINEAQRRDLVQALRVEQKNNQHQEGGEITMLKEWIEIRNDKGELIDSIPILPKLFGRGGAIRDIEIKANDKRLRRHIRDGMQATKIYEDTKKG